METPQIEPLKRALSQKAGQLEEIPQPVDAQRGASPETMEANPFRLLRAEEIECRVARISEKGLSLLLFKDARVDQKLLDETFTPFGWKRIHQSIDGNLYCTVSIWDPQKRQWIEKQDVGAASYAEKEKGQASDSFKRACFNWGLGRELYTAPFIWIPAEKTSIRKNGDRWITSDRFAVHTMACNERREIIALTIVNQNGVLVFEKQSAPPLPGITEAQQSLLQQELERTGISLGTVLKRYGLDQLEQMTQALYEKALRSLRKTKDKDAA